MLLLENRGAFFKASLFRLESLTRSFMFTIKPWFLRREVATHRYPRVKITGAWNVRWIRAGARVGFTCVACDSAPRHPNAAVRVRILSSRSSVLFGAP